MNENYISLWESRIAEIQETGNCNTRLNHPYFSSNYTKESMIEYCERMIERLKLTK